MSETVNNREQPKGTEDKYFGIEFASIEPVMQVYCMAMTGKEVEISTGKYPVTSLRNNWWHQITSGNPTDENIKIVVPAAFMDYIRYDDNYGWYKSVLTQ